MKKVICILLVLFHNVSVAEAKDNVYSESLNSTQEIRYVSSEATQVYFVWGMNNWSIPSEDCRPKGSFIKDYLVYTPMEKTSYGFFIRLKVPSGTLIDYVFYIKTGPAGKLVEVWDTNVGSSSDYHLLAVNDNIVVINSLVNVMPKVPLTILDFSIPFLSLSATLFFLLLGLRTFRFGNIPVFAGPVKIVVASAIILSCMLILIRSSVTGECWGLYLHPVDYYPKVLWSGFYDVIYVLTITSIFLLLFRLFKEQKRIRYFLCFLFGFVSFFSLIAGILNIKMIEAIGKPFNYPWLYYSDFLKSADAQSAVFENISFEYILQILMICAAAFFLVMIIIMVADLLVQRLRMRNILSYSILCLSALYVIFGPAVMQRSFIEYDRLANPIVAFAGSINPFSEDPELFTMKIDDSLKFDPYTKERKELPETVSDIRNVIVFVMESTPAEYLAPYSAEYKITPELEKHLSESVVFDNIYAHAPATNNSMVSILGSIYPWVSYNSLTKEYPDIVLPTISAELKKKGYRTAFFNSADNRFQKAGEFLANRDFDDIRDCNTLNCDAHFEVDDEKWDFLNGKDDECTAEDLIGWIMEDNKKPFFTMMWTYQTHYPYFFSGDQKIYSPHDPVLNRYLNAVHHSDMVLGKLLNALKQNGLYQSTLVVVIGDHGEAFGRHGQTTHASGIYEENLHVPCILINPSFKGEHQTGLGGLVDIAPTIMSQLGYSSASQWQGKDLFTATENDRVYFFTPWSDYLFGYRERNNKFIYNATQNKSEMYDLKNDPHETNNIAFKFPKEMNLSHKRLAGWVQSLDQHMSKLMKTPSESKNP